jgi:hypothetical protein
MFPSTAAHFATMFLTHTHCGGASVSFGGSKAKTRGWVCKKEEKVGSERKRGRREG